MKRLFQNLCRARRTVTRVCTLAVCIMASVAKAEAKDFFSAPQEKNLLTCSDGTVLRGMYYETSRKVESITASPQYNCGIMVNGDIWLFDDQGLGVIRTQQLYKK